MNRQDLALDIFSSTLSSSLRHIFHLPEQIYLLERTFAWLNRFRRLSKDYECYPSTSKANRLSKYELFNVTKDS